MNRAILSDLIKQAQGNRTLTQFAKDCGISTGNLSKIINNSTGQAPLPDTLKKIARNSQGGVTFRDLSIAAGYNSEELIEDSKIDLIYKIQEIKGNLGLYKENFVFEGETVSEEALEIITNSLTSGLEQAILYCKIERKIKILESLNERIKV